MKRTTELTKSEAADIIRNFVANKGGAWDWDSFLSIEITNPELGDARDRCNAMQSEYPSTQGYCNEHGLAELLRIADQLQKDGESDQTVQLKGWEAYDYRQRASGGAWITRTERLLIIFGFCLTIPLTIVGIYAIYWVFILHHMFIMRWSR